MALKPKLCRNQAFTGPTLVVECKLTRSGRAEVPLTRSAPAQRGIAVANGLQVGDFCAVELDDTQVPWALLQVLTVVYEHTGECMWLACAQVVSLHVQVVRWTVGWVRLRVVIKFSLAGS